MFPFKSLPFICVCFRVADRFRLVALPVVSAEPALKGMQSHLFTVFPTVTVSESCVCHHSFTFTGHSDTREFPKKLY